MRTTLAAAIRGVLRAPGRSLALLSLLCAAFLALTLIRAGYANMFEGVRESMIRSEGDLSLSLSKGRGLTLGEYRRIKGSLLSGGRFSSIRASVPIDGLVGSDERSAPASGLAIEDSGLAFDAGSSWAEIDMGEALARTLGAESGDELSALIGGEGLSLSLASTVRTEAAMLDRFYIKMPLEILEEMGSQGRVGEIALWLADPDDSVISALGDINSITKLSGYKPLAYELGNTVANSIVGVYEESFRVVLIAVSLTMLLAFGNAMLISAWERGAEWGTMLALGSPFGRVASLLAAEAVIIAAAAAIAGSILTLAISAIANLSGGIALPPPPTQTNPLIVGFKPEAASLALAFGIAIACAVISALAAAIGIRRRRIVELLFERN